ncbi:hypothetical protein PUN28_006352 [Cardiocondyla obscurior]|uniref:Uncharacterized protein n=1 Tax=Cardiocondyla obscurior TaxID=286306 RepID=A0AAW2GAC6_9HYME
MYAAESSSAHNVIINRQSVSRYVPNFLLQLLIVIYSLWDVLRNVAHIIHLVHWTLQCELLLVTEHTGQIGIGPLYICAHPRDYRQTNLPGLSGGPIRVQATSQRRHVRRPALNLTLDRVSFSSVITITLLGGLGMQFLLTYNTGSGISLCTRRARSRTPTLVKESRPASTALASLPLSHGRVNVCF